MLVFRYIEMKNYWQDAGHMTKMTTMSIYGKKTFKNLVPWSQWNDFDKNWYVESGTSAHHSLFKLWPWVDLEQFSARSNFTTWAFILKMWQWWLLQLVTWKLVDIHNYMSEWKYKRFPWLLPSIKITDIQDPDIRRDLTGPLVLWFYIDLPKKLSINKH